MQLTSAQKATLKTYINANLAANVNAKEYAAIANALNAVAVPDFIVWKSALSTAEVNSQIVWTEVLALSQQARDTFVILMNANAINPSDANIRTAFSAIFGAGTTLTQLTALAKRQATLAEKQLATGTGSTGSPATLGAEGSVSAQDVIDILQ